MSNVDPLKPILNVKETAELLGVHPNTIGNWVRAGTLVSARVPGARAHRFARDEVLRLQRERGRAASPVTPITTSAGPELVTANELDMWAGRDDAKTTFPELMRRLLALTPGVTNIDVRAHEGNAAGGWDGTATSTGSQFLPAGELRMEFGTDRKIKAKAQTDWDKRVATIPAERDAVFVFATPRNWAEHKVWASDRKAEKHFGDVKVVDSHVLEGWLQFTPAVHYWISEVLGYRPRDAQTLERWWASFAGRVRVELPSKFFTAGREEQVRELTSALAESDAASRAVTIQTVWRDEALAFVYASMSREPELMARTVVVSDSRVWHRLIESRSPLVLIPMFDDPLDTAAAYANGHRVVKVAGPDDAIRDGSKILLPKVSRLAARDALEIVVPDSSEAERLTGLARRSTAAFIRSLARDSALQAPSWLSDLHISRVLASLFLLGSWARNEGDVEIVERLTGCTFDEVDQILSSLASRPDAPFVRSGGLWILAAPEEAALLLMPRLTQHTLALWAAMAQEVLLEPDPLFDAEQAQPLTAREVKSRFSATLKEGVAQGLALAAANADDVQSSPRLDEAVNSIVRKLLAAANADKTGALWDSLARQLPLLSEAAPDEFIDALDVDLSASEPIVRTLFRDKKDAGLFGPSSPHPSLIWALENLGWTRDHFGQAADLLGRLATIDPGGRLSNRPLESLQSMVMGWIVNSAATAEEKLIVIKRLLERNEEHGWQLAVALLPNAHMISVPPHAPKYRDWTPTRSTVSFAEWGSYVHSLVGLVLSAASSRPDRWGQLVPKIDEFPPDDRALAFDALLEVVRDPEWSDDDRHAVWEAITTEADRHEEYAEADWAMSPNDVDKLRKAASLLIPESDPRRLAKLFDWRAKVTGIPAGEPGYDEEVQRLRIDAIREVIASGPEALRRLVSEVKTPHIVGYLVADAGDDGLELLSWLHEDEPNLKNAAVAFVHAKILQDGFEWARLALASSRLAEAPQRELFMKAVPFRSNYWSQIANLDEDAQRSYWSSPNVYQLSESERAQAIPLLLHHGRQWGALTLVSLMIQSDQRPDIDLVKAVLGAMADGPEPMNGDVTMDSYYLGNALQFLETHAPDDEDLPRFEFTFFELLHDHSPSTALYRHLGTTTEDFIVMVQTIYRANGEAVRTPTSQEQAFAHNAWSVLHNWKRLPGMRDDETIDGGQLADWVQVVRTALEASGHGAIGDEQVGQILSTSPIGADGVWPAETVRDLIESLGNTRVDTGVHIGKYNQRGVWSRGVFDGGDQERALEQAFRQDAAKVATRWPRTARILRGLADDYRHEAGRADAEAERRSDGV